MNLNQIKLFKGNNCLEPNCYYFLYFLYLRSLFHPLKEDIWLWDTSRKWEYTSKDKETWWNM